MISLAAGAMFFAAPVFAQDSGEEGSTDSMTVLETNETPADFEKRIRIPESASEATEKELMLPESASEQGRENSEFGMERANQARQEKREFGRQRALEAREGKTGENIREQLRDGEMNRERIREQVRENVLDERKQGNNR